MLMKSSWQKGNELEKLVAFSDCFSIVNFWEVFGLEALNLRLWHEGMSDEVRHVFI